MKDPLVSIVIPVYNAEKYLVRCLESVAGQTYRNLQIILVDDGSRDRSGAICREWAARDRRMEYVRIPNSGQAAATNQGMDLAAGRYLFFFDSDDYVDEAIVELCVRSAVEHDADAVAYGRWDLYPNGKRTGMPLRIYKTCYRAGEIRTRLLPELLTYRLGLGMGTCGRMYRRELLERMGLRFDGRSCGGSEDVLFALKFLSEAETVSIVPRRLYHYCHRADSVSAAYRPDRQNQNDRFLEESLAWAGGRSLPRQVTDGLKARYHYYTIAAMKQVLESDLPGKARRRALGEIFRDPMLRQTLTPAVLRLEKPGQRWFFWLLKWRLYHVCGLLLLLKIKTR